MIDAFLDTVAPESSPEYEWAIDFANMHIPEIKDSAKDRATEYLENELEDLFAGYPEQYIEVIYTNRLPEVYDLIDDWEPDEGSI